MRFLLALAFLCVLSAGAGAQTLKVGDMVEITVYQDSKLDRRVLVGRDGNITVPLAGHIKAAGKTLQAVEAELKDKLQKNYADPLDITVGLAEVAKSEQQVRPPMEEDLKPRVFVTGEVIRPGSFPVRKPTTLMQAVALAGGFGPYAAKSRIQVRRQSRGDDLVLTFNYNDFERGYEAANIVLQAGDIIIVPERGLFE